MNVPAPATPNPPEKKADWETAKRVLAEIHRKAPVMLAQGVIIGGIACWFYRQLLAKADDLNFKVPDFSPAQNQLWLSKDLDFTNLFAEDARNMLHENVVRDSQGRQHLIVAGVPIGFAQVGVTFDPESAYLNSWIGTFSTDDGSVEFRVLDPIALYREKLALSQRRGGEADHLHCALVAEFLRFETCRQVADLVSAIALSDKSISLAFLAAIRDRAPEICRDVRLRSRIEQTLAAGRSLAPAEQRLIREIAFPSETP